MNKNMNTSIFHNITHGKIYALENLSKAHIDENMKLSKCAA